MALVVSITEIWGGKIENRAEMGTMLEVPNRDDDIKV